MKKQDKTKIGNTQIDSAVSEKAATKTESATVGKAETTDAAAPSKAAELDENAKRFIEDYLNDNRRSTPLTRPGQHIQPRIIVITMEQKAKLDSISDAICDALINGGLCIEVLREAWKIGLSKARDLANRLAGQRQQDTGKQETSAS